MRAASIAAIALVFAATAAMAEPLPVPPRLPDGAMALARAGQLIELTRDTRPISAGGRARVSDLRVRLAVLDTRPATASGPTHDLHLVLFNDVEGHGTAWAVEPVGSVFAVEQVARIGDGVYDIVAVLADPSGATTGCHFRRTLLSIDARALSVRVRHAAGLEPAGTHRYAEPVVVTADPLDCAR